MDMAATYHLQTVPLQQTNRHTAKHGIRIAVTMEMNVHTDNTGVSSVVCEQGQHWCILVGLEVDQASSQVAPSNALGLLSGSSFGWHLWVQI